ncbi:hypothetical protein P7C71_g498, partial [Lecanoromycetidae sp. Uapishka_2]
MSENQDLLDRIGKLAVAANPVVDEETESSKTSNGWVMKRDRHMQLINTSVYDKETQARNKAIEETRKQKSLKRDQREKQKIERHLSSLRSHTSYGATAASVHEISINGLRFHVIDGGSKLARIRGEANTKRGFTYWNSQFLDLADSASTTPKQANIGGVAFLRSKHGNLYRSGIVKAKIGSEEEDDSDIVSDDEYDEIDSDDVDSDGLEMDPMDIETASHELSQQNDFVGFSRKSKAVPEASTDINMA